MSLASSDTAISTAPPKVAAVFLAQFDVKLGYKLVWHTSPTNVDLAGIEAKALPSGVHEYLATSIYLAHESRGKLYYGVARFRQLNENAPGGSDRLLVKMYSLGILVEPLKCHHWTPHEFSAIGWEHLSSLDSALATFLSDSQLAPLEELALLLTGPDALDSVSPSHADHPLARLPAALSAVGPLIFPLYKAALLRKSILLFNHASQGHSELRDALAGDPPTCGALAYVLALISVVPRDVQMEATTATEGLYSRPLYTVGLYDVESHMLEHHPGFVAATSDEILKYQKLLYDVGVEMPESGLATCRVFASCDPSLLLKATYNDYTKFLKVYRKLPQSDESSAPRDDLSSIRTSSSVFSALRLGVFGGDKHNKLTREPAWWFNDATAPMSWREYIWLAFAWFASAGTTERETSKIDLACEESDVARSEMLQLASIVGHFHKLTKKWFYIIEEILMEAVTGGAGKITLELTLQDVVDMELDPYSQQDLQFVREFVLMYWGDSVDEVEFGLGIHGIFC